MVALISLLVVVVISMITVHVGAVALVMTGLSRDVAAFQAQSAFSGVGFTTGESESLVTHPVRRRILRILMLLGNAGLTSAMATLILTFVGDVTKKGMVLRFGVIAVALLILWWIASSQTIDRLITRLTRAALARWTSLRIYDYERLLQVGRGYGIVQINVEEGDWVAGRTLQETELNREGILVLGIHRADGGYVGSPMGRTRIEPGDALTCYGPEETVYALAERHRDRQGDAEHREAVERERTRRAEEAVADAAHMNGGPSLLK